MFSSQMRSYTKLLFNAKDRQSTMAVRVIIFLCGGRFGHRAGRIFPFLDGNRIRPIDTVTHGIAIGRCRHLPERVFSFAGTIGSVAERNL